MFELLNTSKRSNDKEVLFQRHFLLSNEMISPMFFGIIQVMMAQRLLIDVFVADLFEFVNKVLILTINDG
jgi:hypothetical protein